MPRALLVLPQLLARNPLFHHPHGLISLLPLTCLINPTRSYAEKAAEKPAGGKAGGKGAAAAGKGKAPTKAASSTPVELLPPISGTRDNIVRGVNIFKNKTDPPLLPDSQYPSWLWDFLTDKPETVQQSQGTEKERESKQQQPDLPVRKMVKKERQKAIAQGGEAPLDLISLLDIKKVLRRKHKQEIKKKNSLRAKK